MTVRALKNIGKIGALLPHGPAMLQEDLDGAEVMTNDKQYELFITRMEREVVNLLALDDKAAKQFIGRADGPKFVQQKKTLLRMSMAAPERPRLCPGPGDVPRDGWMTW